MKNYHADILSTSCWQDDDDTENPPHFGWQIEHLWINSDGKYSTCDCDGNHEHFDGRGIRSFYRDAEQSWKDYAVWVRKNLSDPLGNYCVSQTIKVTQRWTATTTKWVGSGKHGLAVTELRHGKQIVPIKDAPKEVKDYFCLHKVGGRWCIEGIHDLKEIPSDTHTKVKGIRVTASVEFTQQNQNYKKELLAILDRNNERLVERPS